MTIDLKWVKVHFRSLVIFIPPENVRKPKWVKVIVIITLFRV